MNVDGPATRTAAIDGRQEETVRRHDPQGRAAPAVFDSPHSGAVYPPSFRPAAPLRLLQGGEDRFVDKLFAEAPRHGAVIIAARFARTFIDPNRSLADLDVALLDGPWPEPVSPSRHTARGVGLIFRKIANGVDIYDRLLSVAEVQDRIDRFWRPYHNALTVALDEAHARFGTVWHINCHSMQPVGDSLSPDPGQVRPDFVLGDLKGRACRADLTAFAGSILEGMGYSVGLNIPYQGAELVQRHGRPAEGRNSLQIEVNRQLYMNVETLERHAGLCRLRDDLGKFAARICEHARTLRA